MNDHFKNLDKIISKYLIFEKKRIIVFLIKEPYQNFIFDKNRKFLNYEFFVININKTHTFKIDDHLNMSGHKFDIITADPIHPRITGVGYLYTKEYYEILITWKTSAYGLSVHNPPTH